MLGSNAATYTRPAGHTEEEVRRTEETNGQEGTQDKSEGVTVGLI